MGKGQKVRLMDMDSSMGPVLQLEAKNVLRAAAVDLAKMNGHSLNPALAASRP